MKKQIVLCTLSIMSFSFFTHVHADAQRRKNAFTQIYKTNFWQGEESISGPGSNIATTETIRMLLPHVMRLLKIETLLDAACGDCNWMLSSKLPIKQYTGADIVEELIAKNKQRYGNDTHRFVCLDIVKDPLPRADAIICRDCLAHLSFEEISEALINFKKSGAKYLFASSYPLRENRRNIRSGGFRPVNLQIAPFNLPEPIIAFDELSAEQDMKNVRKRMCVWILDEIKLS